MNDFSLLHFHSYTVAMNAHTALQEMHIKSDIIKTISTSQGCLFALKIYSDIKEAVAILSDRGISYIHSEYEGWTLS